LDERDRIAFRCGAAVMLVHFTLSSALPRVTGSTVGMGLALTDALQAARAADAPVGRHVRDVGELAARNAIPSALLGHLPVGGGALLDILV
jgi:hypothetical protein